MYILFFFPFQEEIYFYDKNRKLLCIYVYKKLRTHNAERHTRSHERVMGDKSPKNLENDNKRENSKMIASEPVRSRWTPKPEQILVLEHIFNSGMVNPPKDETVRIRRLLEKFGPVGDANVFYWFQNRRSRSRRRQKQMGIVGGPSSGVIQCNSSTLLSSSNSSSTGGGSAFSSSSSTNLIGDNKAADNDLFTISRQMGVPKEQLGKTPIITPTSFHHLHYQPATGNSLINQLINRLGN